MNGFWQDKRVLITGGKGFLGGFVVKRLQELGCSQLFTPSIKEYNLIKEDNIIALLNDTKPHVIIHLAASVGGIGANQKNPGRFFYENAMMGIQLIEQARLANVDKFVLLGTVCAYPKYTPVPFKEENLWNGYPEETNAPYGLAKRMLIVQAQSYREQYGFNAISLLPVNLYGPRDNIDLENSHVIPAIIRKCIDAIKEKKDKIVVWGTGQATREFLYVEDAARGIVMAAENYNKPEPVNLGSSYEISIKELVEMIARLTGFTGEIIWDASKPDGQPRRKLDVSRAEKEFGFKSSTTFEEGLHKTIEWYRNTLI